MRKKFTGAFYREFSRRALPLISDMMDYMWSEDDKCDDWYPDVVSLASEVFLEILSDYGYGIPEYMTRLEWNEDYVSNKNACRDAVQQIQDLYASTPEAFQIDGGQIIVSLGFGSGKQKLMESWYNTLPPEVAAESRTTMQDGSVLKMDLKEMERLGFRYKGFRWPFPFFRRKR